MKKLALILTVVLLAPTSWALIDSRPDYSMLWNGFTSATTVDSFIVVTVSDAVVVLAPDSDTTFAPVNHIFLETRPIGQKLSGNVLTVHSQEHILYFLDVSNLPNVQLLGQADFGFPFHDFALFGQDIYVCNGYKGLWRYTMVNYQSLTFADSSMIGIHCTKVEIHGTDLYALDDYNGLLHYKLTGIGFGQYLSTLYIPLRATSFALVDTAVVIALEKPKLMLASFNQSPPVITDTFDLFFEPKAVYGSGNYAVALNAEYQVAERINVHTREHMQFELSSPLHEQLDGQALEYNGENHVLLPSADGGLALYNVDRGRLAGPIFLRPGPISDLVMTRHYFFVAGLGNPLHVYSLAADGEPIERQTQYPGVRGIQALDREGDRLAVYYSSINDVMLLDIGSQPITMALHFYLSSVDLRGVLYNDDHIDTLQSLFAFREFAVQAYTISDSNYVSPAFDQNIVDRINDIEVIDSMLFVSTGKARIPVYRIYRDFHLGYQDALGLPREAPELQSWRDNLLVFAGEQLVVYDVSNMAKAEVVVVVPLPFSVVRSAVDGDWLAAVGPSGFMLIDMGATTPSVVDYGGRGGDRIATANGIVAVADGEGVHLFDMRGVITDAEEAPEPLPLTYALSQNYPNPFNPTTSIDYTLPARSRVRLEVFNILGRRVTTLVDTEQPAGAYSLVWNGEDRTGKPVASGVYFYRLTAGDFVSTKKMVFLK